MILPTDSLLVLERYNKLEILVASIYKLEVRSFNICPHKVRRIINEATFSLPWDCRGNAGEHYKVRLEDQVSHELIERIKISSAVSGLSELETRAMDLVFRT